MYVATGFHQSLAAPRSISQFQPAVSMSRSGSGSLRKPSGREVQVLEVGRWVRVHWKGKGLGDTDGASVASASVCVCVVPYVSFRCGLH